VQALSDLSDSLSLAAPWQRLLLVAGPNEETVGEVADAWEERSKNCEISSARWVPSKALRHSLAIDAVSHCRFGGSLLVPPMPTAALLGSERRSLITPLWSRVFGIGCLKQENMQE
jgi:hypothetical protein